MSLGGRKWLWLSKDANWILWGAVFLRVVVSSIVITRGVYMAVDSPRYISLAEALVESMHFGMGASNELFRTPIYPLFLSGCMLISKKYFFLVAIMLQQSVNIGIFLIWRKLLRIFISSNKVRMTAEILYAIDLQSIFYNTQILTDALFQSFVLLFVYWMVMFWKRHSEKYLIGSGFLIGGLLLLRPIAVYLPIAIFIGVITVYLTEYGNLKRGIRISIKFLLCALLPMLGWCCRNYLLEEKFTVSTVANYNTYVYYAGAVEAELKNQNYYDVIAQREERINSAADNIENEKMIESGLKLLKEHPAIYIKYHLKGMLLECIYPGQIDLLTACSDSFEKGKENLKSILTSDQNFGGKIAESVRYVVREDRLFALAGVSLAGEVVFLAGVFGCFAGNCIMKSVGYKWYEKWMLIGIAAYFWICGGTPFGIGSYPRFRLPFIYIVLLCAMMRIDRMIKCKGT